MEAQNLWKRINDEIKSHNTTQRALALKCGFTERRIESLSSANRLPDAIEITKIAEALGTTVEYLVTGQSTAPKPDTSRILETLNTAIQQVKEL